MAPLGCIAFCGRSASGGDDVLLVRTGFENTEGVYEPLGPDCRGYPQWQRRQGRPYLYKYSGQRWTIGPRLGDEEHFDVIEDTRAKTPLALDEWTKEGGEVHIAKMKNVSTRSAPQLVSVQSQYRNIAGGYERMDRDFDGFPAYYCKDKAKYLFHVRASRVWVLADTLGARKNVYSEFTSDSVNVADLDWKDGDKVDRLEEVSWAMVPDDTGFLDTGFPADHSSLGESWLEQHPQFQDPESVEWIRSTELNRDENSYLFGEVRPSDIFQGKVANCWLISAISCAAEFPSAIQDLIEPKDIASDGMYKVKLYDVQAGSWVETVIDDLVPCETRRFWERYAKPLFAYTKSAYVWPLIMEKAFAKFCGNYSVLHWGSIGWAWQALTGCEQQRMYRRERSEAGLWRLYVLNIDDQRRRLWAGERRAAPFHKANSLLDADKLWAVVHSGIKYNYLMAAHIENKKEVTREDGLVEGHSYSLVLTASCQGFRLVKLRNPWGTLEWNGAWSDGDTMWEENPEVTKQLEPENAADGCFWMAWEDFVVRFTCINICLQEMPHQRSRGQAQDSSRPRTRSVSFDAKSLTSSSRKKQSTRFTWSS
eukprot:TRINITY_DN36673_c0_g1_i2.p1 TRINITY_DN36673_c0_g1~~TRINITY_DN36673_c0_g1_i2.p1  ORF type:complete len:593 (-),score=112.17 TRINITY_DN36673_c0_g1_i2:10-1788(-)